MAVRMTTIGRVAQGSVSSTARRAFATGSGDKVTIGVVGYGGIGKELVNQIGGFIKKGNTNFEFRGIADIDGMTMNPTGMNLEKSAYDVGMEGLCSQTEKVEADLEAW